MAQSAILSYLNSFLTLGVFEMTRMFIVSSLAVLMVVLVVLSQALQPSPKGDPSEKIRKEMAAKMHTPEMQNKMLEAEKIKRKKYEEYKKRGKLPKLDIDPKDDWYNYQQPGAEGLKQLEEAKK